MQSISKLFVITLFFAILLRILLLIWSLPLNQNGDQWRYEDWARVAHIYGWDKTYTGGYNKFVINNMPPGTLYIISGAYEAHILIGKIVYKLTDTVPGSNQFINSYILHLVMRFPSIITDLLMGLLAFLLVKKERGEKSGVLASALILFNPVIFYNSTVWGQMDSLNNFFFLLSLFLAFRKNYILSILAYAFSLYIKLPLLPFLPFYFTFLYFHSGKNWKTLLLGSGISLGLITLATFSVSPQPWQWLMTTIPVISQGELQNITVAAFNFWWMATCPPINCSDSLPVIGDKFLGLTLNTWGYLLFGIATLPIFYLQVKKSQLFTSKQFLFLAFSLIAVALFLFLPKMHDRYLYPLFPLFAVAIALSKERKPFLIIFGILTLFHMGNLIYSFYPTYFPHEVFDSIVYGDPFRWIISAIIVITSVLLYKISVTTLIKIESGVPHPKLNSKNLKKRQSRMGN